MLVATHSDTVAPRKISQGDGAEELRRKVDERFGAVFSIEETVAVVDAHAANSPGMKVRMTRVTGRQGGTLMYRLSRPHCWPRRRA